MSNLSTPTQHILLSIMIMSLGFIIGCGQDISEINAASNAELEPSNNPQPFDSDQKNEGQNNELGGENPLSYQLPTSDQTQKIVILDQLSSGNSHANLSQINMSRAATRIQLEQDTQITSLSWTGVMMSPPMISRFGNLDETKPSETAHFMIQVFSGHNQPDTEPLQELSIEAQLTHYIDQRVEYYWSGTQLHGLVSGTYWISIIGAEPALFYWEASSKEDDQDNFSSSAVSAVSEEYQEEYQNEYQEWELLTTDDEYRGFSIKLEGLVNL